jgi:uncharacterized protein
MTVVLLAFAFMVFIVVAMAVGVLLGRKPIAGSCGGLSAIGMKSSCDVCGGKDKICEEEQKKRAVADRNNNESAADLAYNAAKVNKSDK